MFHGGAKYSTDHVKCSTEVLNIPQQCQMFHRGAKYSTESVKSSTEAVNIPRTVSNVPRRC